MPEYIDTYYLIESREPDLITRFLNSYLPLNDESAQDYPIPLHADNPVAIFIDFDDLFSYLKQEKNMEYAVYWHNRNMKEVIQHLMVFHTDDECMIFGVSFVGNDPTNEDSISLYYELKDFLKASVGCMTVEEPPSFNSIEFRQFAKSRYIPS